MNDADYIKAAVELADGWTVKATEFQEWYTAPEPCGDWFADGSPRAAIMLDALAAQLKRQVLAAGFDIDIEIQGSHFEAPGIWVIIHDPVKSERLRFEYDARDFEYDARDHEEYMAAIKAIVDSKVLT